MLKRLIENHVLANISFGLVILLGYLAFDSMPRAKNPDQTFNYVNIFTGLPGASAPEVERRITDPIEERIANTIADIDFIESSSTEGTSTITLRFEEISDRLFRERLAKLRREVQNLASSQLPDEAIDPEIESLGSASFPAAMVIVKAERYDEAFRAYASRVETLLEKLPGVDSARSVGLTDPELRISFYPERLLGVGISPPDLADTVAAYLRDASIGDIETQSGRLILRLTGTASEIEDIRQFPIVTARGVVELGQIAEVSYASSESLSKVTHRGADAMMFYLSRQKRGNELEIIDELKKFVAQENARQQEISSGYRWVIVDDQTITTREAISMMQSNAIIGLCMVVLISFLFLGSRIALLTAVGIPFTLCATFIVLDAMGRSVNNTALLGVIVALGMIVDDAVVVVEAIYYRLQRGVKAIDASIGALKEVAAPVLTSILTTISVFLPLVLLPGVLGSFLAELPTVVCIALAISLLEAFWILPAHISFLKVGFEKESNIQRLRLRFTHGARRLYARCLIYTFRNPLVAVCATILPCLLAALLLAIGAIKLNFFPEDPERSYYINLTMSPESTLEETNLALQDIERVALSVLETGELAESIAYSGIQITQLGAEFTDNVGQVYMSFRPRERGMRTTPDLLAAIREAVESNFDGGLVSFTAIGNGPPVALPVSIRFMGDDYDVLNQVVAEVKAFMASQPEFYNISDGFKAGPPMMVFKLRGDAIKSSGLHPDTVTRSLQAFVDGQLVGQFQRNGEEVDIRVVAINDYSSGEDLLLQTIANPDGQEVSLGELVDLEYASGPSNLKHYDYQRSITLESSIDTELTDVVTANQKLIDFWEAISPRYPGLRVNNKGQFDDIANTLESIAFFFLVGMGLIYLILGTQFRSYVQPLIVLLTVPLAFSGVVFGSVITGNSLTMFSMYGVVALAGIAVNAAIVLLSAANQRIDSGMGVLQATVYAARRRFIPIIITTFTTIAGLFSLAAGLAGSSEIWGPLAIAIVSGLFFSTPLILFAIPHVYRLVMSSRLATI